MQAFPYILAIVTCCIAVLPSCGHRKNEERLVDCNPHNIAFRSKKIATVETPNAGPIAVYTLSAKNVPPRRNFYLFINDPHDKNELPIPLRSDECGRLWILPDMKTPLAQYPITVGGFFQGEHCKIWLISKDKSTTIPTKCVPYPLETFANDGAEVSIVRETKNASLVTCSGKYFKQGEELHIVSIGKNKSSKMSAIICEEDGTFKASLSPPDLKSYGEVITVELARQNGEVVRIQYPWGREALSSKGLMGRGSEMQHEDRVMLNEAVQKYFNPRLNIDNDI